MTKSESSMIVDERIPKGIEFSTRGTWAVLGLSSPLFFCADSGVREEVAVWARTSEQPVLWSVSEEGVWQLLEWPGFAALDPRSAWGSVAALRSCLADDQEGVGCAGSGGDAWPVALGAVCVGEVDGA